MGKEREGTSQKGDQKQPAPDSQAETKGSSPREDVSLEPVETRRGLEQQGYFVDLRRDPWSL